MKVICTLPNAGTEINGVKFEAHKLGNKPARISEEIDEDTAAHFLKIKGYVRVQEAPKAPDTSAAASAATAAAAASAATAAAAATAKAAAEKAVPAPAKEEGDTSGKDAAATADKAAAGATGDAK